MASSWGLSFLGIGGSWLNTWSGDAPQPGDPDAWGTSWGGVGGTWGYTWRGSWVEPAAPEVVTGGFLLAFEHFAAQRRKRKRELEEAEEAAQRLSDAIDREIALLLQERERKAEFQSNIERLSNLVKRFADSEAAQALSERVQTAFARAVAQETVSAYLALQRELDRMLEEEEVALLLILNDD